ncbi:MAG: PD40 domain-containing protein [Alistipes sp.]|nr:PD40 domain-containing protein [Alistipes sp.]
MKIGRIFLVVLSMATFVFGANAQSVDYSVVSVPEESGLDIMQVTSANDYVCMPLVQRKGNSINWFSNKIIDISVDGKNIAYLSFRNNMSNIFIKELGKQGGSVQRTNRQNVIDFSYSPDGKHICFSENRGQSQQVFLTDAHTGYVCRQITSSNYDYSPIFTSDMQNIIFARMENNGVSIWGYSPTSNFISSYTTGLNPYPIKNSHSFLCTRVGGNGRSEIWKIDYSTGVEECIVSDPQRSFTTPVLSPDGEWILFTGETTISAADFTYRNTDIYVCKIDGTNLMQITYHAADDLSPTWSHDGRYIYFISQRGSADATANVWRMNFQYY